MASGGARSGAGRKPKAAKYKLPINRAEKRIVDRLPSLIDNLFELANGVLVEEISKEGNVTIFKRAPDFKANEYLLNRIMGKPTERLEAEVLLDDVSVHDTLERKLANLAARVSSDAAPGGSDALGEVDHGLPLEVSGTG